MDIFNIHVYVYLRLKMNIKKEKIKKNAYESKASI